VAYDRHLADRVRALTAGEDNLTERKMFGGLAFLLQGNMSVGVSHEGGLLLRVDPEQTEALLAKPHTRPLVMRGRALDGWLRVEPEGLATSAQLERWVARGVDYARRLPPKGR
jgi:TfoX/Sxy family transcriptional regulator of competence genes